MNVPALPSLRGFFRVLTGSSSVRESARRQTRLEALLGRDTEPAPISFEQSRALAGKSVLVTGAGGSIGSEVCRRLLYYGPAHLILVEMSEAALYEIDLELRELQRGASGCEIIPLIGDVRNEDTRRRIFENYDVHVVFHCAAYKHVPMMELNPNEAVLNNVQGTVEFASSARDAGVDRFVLISTDKAVRPISIMGATKRIAELYVQGLALATDTRFLTVRFGNVMGSSGSVIPLFQRQIESGGPVTVTHPGVERYFMTVAEAANLVIQAGVMHDSGEMFVLDMGRPVRIDELAREMISASGKRIGRDIRIEYIGLRPGDKLTEELTSQSEVLEQTPNARIRRIKSNAPALPELRQAISELVQVARSGNRAAIDACIRRIVPEYDPGHGRLHGRTHSQSLSPESSATG